MPEPSAGPSALRVYRATQDAQLVAAAQERPQQCDRTLRNRGAPSRTAADRERTCGTGVKRGAPRGVAVPIEAAEA